MITRVFQISIRVAAWATPHLKRWHRERHINSTEAQRHLEARNWTEAEKHFTLALEERKNNYSRTMQNLLGLEKALRNQSKFVEAEQIAGQAVELATKEGNRTDRALAMEAIVDIDLAQNKYAEAEQATKEILQAEESRSSPDHELVARCLRKLGTALVNCGRPAEALDALQRAAKWAEKGFGANHAETGNALAELGALQRQLGNHEEAQKHIRGALKIHREKLGSSSLEATQDLHQLAMSLQESGDLVGAMGEYEKVLALSERQIGANRQSIAETQVRLAVLYMHADRPSAARELLTHAIGTVERSGGECAAYALEALAMAEEQSGRPVEAERWRARAAKLAVN
jgi:regulator of sirC expression with transglutaminase-like and TPR domain